MGQLETPACAGAGDEHGVVHVEGRDESLAGRPVHHQAAATHLPQPGAHHTRRMINTEEKAKVVAAVWGTEFIQFHAELAVLH